MPDHFGSHLPVLEALCEALKPKRVLEFGSGRHSTPFFLSLPIERLVTIESDPTWFARALEFKDERLTLLRELDPEDADLADYDLVFIDDGQSIAERTGVEERVETIRWVLAQDHPPVVIHDAEVSEYARVMAELSPSPATAVVF